MAEVTQPVDTLVQIADLHFWQVVTNPLELLNKRFLGNLNVWLRRRHEFPMERAEPFAQAVTAVGTSQVLFTGDFSSTSTEEEFAMGAVFVRRFRERGFNILVLPGNHDVYTFESVRKGRFERHFAEFLPQGGYPAQTTLAGGTPVILVPTVCPNPLTARGRVTPETVEIVARLLAESAGAAIVAGHYPVLHRTYGYASRPSRQLRNAEALRTCLGASGRRILYVCGHVHRFSYVADPDYSSLAHLSTGAFFRTDLKRGRLGEFTEIQVRADGFDVFHHTYEAVPGDPEAAPRWIRRKIEPCGG